jgi:hypothetical protein
MHDRTTPTTRRWIWAAPAGAMLAAALLSGCPSLTIEQVELDAETLTSESFTLTATVRVVEEDPPIDDEGDLGGGRGVLGVWLPPGWAASGARIAGPDDTSLSELTPLEDAAGHFPPAFPFTPGDWFAFASECENLPAGTFIYEIEIDIQGDGSQDELTCGVSTALFDDGGSNGPAPIEIQIDLAAGTAEVREPPPAPAPSGQPSCESIPYEDQNDDSGCTCSNPGAAGGRVDAVLLGLLSALL